VVRDLEQVDARQAAIEERRVDALFDVPGEQEPASVRLAQEDDRDVVDRRPCIRRVGGHAARIGPQDLHRDFPEAQPRARRQHAVRWSIAEDGAPRRPAGAGPAHARLVDPAHGVALEDPGEPGDVVLVRVGEHDDVEAAVPRGDPLVEGDEDPVRVRAAVHEHPGAGPRLEQDRVPLADVEDGDPGRPSRRLADGRSGEGDRDRPGDEQRPPGGRDARTAPGSGATGGRRECRLPHPSRPAPTPTAKDVRRHEQRDGRDGRDGEGQGGRQGDRRERHGSADPDDGDHDVQDEPARQPEERGHHGWCPGGRGEAAREGKDAARHRDRHQRDHRQVHHR
jgi:hypothetical protein